MKWIKSPDESHWHRECGRYYVCRSLAFDRNPEGHWVHLAWFKQAADVLGELISPERRDTFKEAAADCAVHVRAHKPKLPHTPQLEASASVDASRALEPL
jgi:hypothetical protein